MVHPYQQQPFQNSEDFLHLAKADPDIQADVNAFHRFHLEFDL